jgi:intracellular sulfur oxidation DsrE/DsrF family protein
MSKPSDSPMQRRLFVTGVNAGAASLAGIALTRSALAQVKSPGARWEPARHDQDDWFDAIPGKHRLLFDTTTPDAFGEALLFANNFMIANRNDYGLQNSDMAIVIVARHRSTGFGFNDSMWTKYGAQMGPMARFEDPKNKTAPKSNLYNAGDFGSALPNRGTTIDFLAKQGVHFAVCSMATRALAGSLAQASGGSADAVNAELIANLVGNARMVPAGIVAVSRAQERGYTLVSA